MNVLLSQIEVSAMLGMNLRTFQRRLLNSPDFPAAVTNTAGKRLGYLESEVIAYMKGEKK